MPELPEVETICRGLKPHVEGKRVPFVEVRRTDLCTPVSTSLVSTMTGKCIKKIARRGKYLLFYFEEGIILIIHLGMSGRVRVESVSTLQQKHDHFCFHTENQIRVTLQDPRRFSLIDLTTENSLTKHPRLQRLGYEPFDNALTPKTLYKILSERRKSLKNILLDQTVIAGLGNIYTCESLFHAGLSPWRRADMLSLSETRRLLYAIRHVLDQAITAGGTSLKNYTKISGEYGTFQHQFMVYGRTHLPCPGCICDVSSTGGIQRLIQAQRSTFYCPHRQL